MKKIIFPFISVFFIHSANALTLNEAFGLAKNNSENLKISEAKIDQSKELKNQTVGSIFPKVALNSTWNKYDQFDAQKNTYLSIGQTLFKGGREYSALKMANQNLNYFQYAKNADELTLFSNLVVNYFNAAMSFDDLEDLKLLKKLSEDRLKEIQSRVRIGRSRRGELLQAKAQVGQADALVIGGLGQYQESINKLKQLIGDVAIEHFDPSQINTLPELSLSELQEKLKTRPDLLARKLKVEMTDEDVFQAKSYHYPTVDLKGNYYLHKESSTFKNSDWDVGLTFSMPLFEGGVVQSKYRETVSKREEAILGSRDYEKSLQTDLIVKFETYKRYKDQLIKMKEAYEFSKENYDEAKKDYQLGLVSNLEVLQAMNLYLDNKRNYDRTQWQALMGAYLVKASSGEVL